MNTVEKPKSKEKENEKELKEKINWTKEHENILIDWADKAMCYRWLHSKSNEDFNFRNTMFTIPVIIMSTITGTANFAQDQFPASVRSYAPMIIGSVNIFAGILTTIQQFLKVTELNEAHRVSSIAWDKFFRKISVELAKSPIERQYVIDFIKACTEEYDRLIETSPTIEQKIIKKFIETFEGKNELKLTETQKLFKEIKKPVICNTLESVRYSVYKPPANRELLKKNHHLIELVREKKEMDNKEKIISDFIDRFRETQLREPTEDEIMDNLLNEEQSISLGKIKDFVSKWKHKKDESVQETKGDENV